jgi:SAM-dependent methyltransferase
VTGLDLSPYFLALAEFRERQRERGRGGGGGGGELPSFSPSSSSVSAAATARAALPNPAAAGPDPPGRRRIAYLHANMEATPLPAGSFDLVSANFVVHECRPFAIDAMCLEAARLLRPGGVLAVADNDPASETLQKLPPALFALMKSTEPWSDEYYCYDLEEGMRRAGLEGVVTREADHRHRCVLGRKKK